VVGSSFPHKFYLFYVTPVIPNTGRPPTLGLP
jgi:hypothetical protein